MFSTDYIYDIRTEQLVKFQNIPQEFQDIPNWVVWAYGTSPTGKPTKLPRQPNGRMALTNTPATWSTFDEVLEAFKNGSFDGIGWCIPIITDVTTEYYWGFDYDDALDPDTGEYRTWGELPTDFNTPPPLQPAELEQRLKSYCETTPSKAGFRTFVKSNVPITGPKDVKYGAANPKTKKKPGIETYSDGRYFTFTGNIRPGSLTTVELLTDEATALYNTIHASPKPSSKPSSITHTAPRINSPSNVDELAHTLADGLLESGSRHNLMLAMCGILVKARWKGKDIQSLLYALVVIFNGQDSEYDVQDNVTKQFEQLQTCFDLTISSPEKQLASFTALSKEVTPETLAIVKELVKDTSLPTKQRQPPRDFLKWLDSKNPMNLPEQKINYLIPGVLAEGQFTILTAPGSNGKSTWTLHLVKTILKLLPIREVFCLDRDNNFPNVQALLRRTLGTGESPANFHYWGDWHKDEDGNEDAPPNVNDQYIIDLLQVMQNPVIIVDTLRKFSGCDENDNTEMSKFIAICKRWSNRYGATVLLIHHTGKEGIGPRGASCIGDDSDNVLSLTSTKDETNHFSSFTIVPLQMKALLQTTVFTMCDGEMVMEEKDSMKNREERLYEIVTDNPGISQATLIKHAERFASQHQVRDFVTECILNKTIERKGTGKHTVLHVVEKAAAACLFDEEDEDNG